MSGGRLFPALLALLAWGCGRRATPAQCTEMLDHYVDMVVAGDPELGTLPPLQAARVAEVKKAEKKAASGYARMQRQCEGEVTRSEHECAVAAKTPNDWEACIE